MWAFRMGSFWTAFGKGIITNGYVDAIKDLYPTSSPNIVLGKNIGIPHASPEDGVNKVDMSLLKIKMA